MASNLSPEEEQTFFKEGLYKLVLVLGVDAPQPKPQVVHCFYLASPSIKELRDRGTQLFGESNLGCTSGDHS
jgi:hypothetical protein